jgi:ankyrin repeat protein
MLSYKKKLFRYIFDISIVKNKISSSYEKKNKNDSMVKISTKTLNNAKRNEEKEYIKLVVNAFRNNNEKSIEIIIEGNDENETALHLATHMGFKELVKLLLNIFIEQEKLIDFLMKEDINNITVLHLAAYKGNEEILELLLNAFGKDRKYTLI